MKTKKSWASKGLLFPTMILSFFAVQCSDSPSSSERAGEGDAAMQQMDVENTDAMADDDGGATVATRERRAAVDDLRAMRAQMIAELEQVRARLNDGTRPEPEQEADQARAAELAQGLERADRALALAEFATDANWTNAQDTTRRATNEVRAWWNAHRYPATAKAD